VVVCVCSRQVVAGRQDLVVEDMRRRKIGQE
jgi:hypothetical protein